MRLVEFGFLLVPLLAVLLWRLAVRRGLRGPPVWQLVVLFGMVVGLGGLLTVMASREKLPPGLYVPAEVVNGRIVPGHSR